MDYAGAWSSERGQCFRMVYEPHTTRPMRCPEPIIGTGWRRRDGRWYEVDTCAGHRAQLQDSPGGRTVTPPGKNPHRR